MDEIEKNLIIEDDETVLKEEIDTDENDILEVSGDFEDLSSDYFDSGEDLQEDNIEEKTEEFSDDDTEEKIEEIKKASEFSELQKISSSSMNNLILRRDKLQNELTGLETELQEVRKEGDISESSVYSALIDKISLKRKELNNIINDIDSSVVIERKWSETIDIGDSIRIYSPTIAYEEMQKAPGKLLEIVDAGLGNPMDGKIHVNAPFVREIVKLSKKTPLPCRVKWKTTSNMDTVIYITEIIPYR